MIGPDVTNADGLLGPGLVDEDGGAVVVVVVAGRVVVVVVVVVVLVVVVVVLVVVVVVVVVVVGRPRPNNTPGNDSTTSLMRSLTLRGDEEVKVPILSLRVEGVVLVVVDVDEASGTKTGTCFVEHVFLPLTILHVSTVVYFVQGRCSSSTELCIFKWYGKASLVRFGVETASAVLGIIASIAMISNTTTHAPHRRCQRPCRCDMVPPYSPDYTLLRHKTDKA